MIVYLVVRHVQVGDEVIEEAFFSQEAAEAQATALNAADGPGYANVEVQTLTISDAPKVFVIMGNDYPDAVFSREEDAEAFCDERRRVPGSRIYWRPYDFTLDAKLPKQDASGLKAAFDAVPPVGPIDGEG